MDKNLILKKKIIKWVGIFLGVVLVFTILSKTIYTLLLPRVTTEKVSSGMIQTKIFAQGKLGQDGLTIKRQKVALKASCEGRVANCLVEEGQEVKKGEKLMVIQKQTSESAMKQEEIDREGIEINIASIQRQKNEALEKKIAEQKKLKDKKEEFQKQDKSYEMANLEAQIQVKQEEVSSNEALYKEGFLAEKDYNKSKEELALLKKQKSELEKRTTKDNQESLRTLEESISNIDNQIAGYDDQLKLEMNKLEGKELSGGEETVLSPIDGIVYEVDVAVGATILQNEQVLIVIPKDIPTTLSFEISEDDVDQVKIGQTISWTLKKARKEATVLKKTPSETSGQIIVTCEVAPEILEEFELEFKAYKSVDVEITNSSEPYDLLVSNSAIVKESAQNYIYTIEEIQGNFETSYRVHKTLVTIIKEGNTTSAVSGVLKAQDEIVKSTTKPLSEGLEVAKN